MGELKLTFCSVAVALLALEFALEQTGAYLLTESEDGKPIASQALKSFDGGRLFYVDQVKVRGQEGATPTIRLLVGSGPNTKHWIVDTENKFTSKVGRSNELAYATFGNGLRLVGERTQATIELANLTLEQQNVNFIKTDGQINPFGSNYDGILSVSQLHLPLEELSRVNKQIVCLYLNPVNDNEEQLSGSADGMLLVGGTSKRFYRNSIKYINFAQIEGEQLGDHLLELLEIQTHLSDPQFSKQPHEFYRYNDLGSAVVQFDSTSPLIVGDPEITDHLHRNVLDGTEVVGQYYLLKDCRLDNKPTFVFIFGSRANATDRMGLMLKPEDYVVQLDDETRNQLNELRGLESNCISAFSRPIYQPEPSYWSFGTRIMRKYFMVFDYEKKRMGFALAARV